ncbi:hypothetical protein BH20ACT23_BH20ACT23_13080 [soil metagenome]
MFRLRSRAPSRGRARHLIASSALATLALGCLFAPPPVRAQVSPLEDVTIELVDQPVSHDDEDSLGIEVRITNDGDETLPGFILNVERASRLTSRSDLLNSFDSVPGFAPAQTSPRIVSKSLGPGESRTMTFDEPVTDLFTPGTDDDGIYPATINLVNSEGDTFLDTLTTHLIFYQDGLETRLNLVATVPLNDLPARGPDGDFVVDAPGTQPLEDALQSRGWLAKTVGELRLTDELHLGVAPTPRLVEEIADMSNGYRRGDDQFSSSSPEAELAGDFIRQLSQLLKRDGVQPLLVPYANPDLPSLAASAVDGHVGTQITLGETILSDVLEVEPDRSWIFPPGGRTNSESLELMQLSSNAGAKTFFSGSFLVEEANPLLAGCPIEGLTAACPVSVSTQAGETLGYEADAGLQNRLSTLVREDDDRLNLQRFFAETAMIREEQPGRTDRVVQATLPSLWHPNPRMIRTLYRGLASAPWLNTVTPEEGLALDIDRTDRRVADNAAMVPNELDPFDYATIEQAEATVESFNSVGPPAPMYQRLLRNYLVAESRNWWVDDTLAVQGLDYARAAAEEARAEMGKVSIEVSERITLTSRAEDIPVRVLNDAGYPVRVRFQLDSPRLRFEEERVRTFETGRTPLTIPVRADTSGFFPVTMSLVTPDGSEVIAESQPTVRSTEFNNVALTITVGALFFLIAFYLLRWYRRRNAPPTREPV